MVHIEERSAVTFSGYSQAKILQEKHKSVRQQAKVNTKEISNAMVG